ncbi:hypothetical protein VNO80_21370 [Phaseolus coccineus]|uniref:Zinc finger PHD-type domain-containing protein n=1 Tax=Phaseolus coccineus TaxID=3886 RepID=A0AAN9QT09_PHACN
MEEKFRPCNLCDTCCSCHCICILNKWHQQRVWGLITLLIKPMRVGEPISSLLRKHSVGSFVEYHMQFTNLGIDFQSDDPDKKNSQRSTLDDNFSFSEANCVFYKAFMFGSTLLVPKQTKGVIISKSSTIQLGCWADDVYAVLLGMGVIDPQLPLASVHHQQLPKFSHLVPIDNRQWLMMLFLEVYSWMDLVCDICGDVGQEEDLAICNKCTDGAEHIYCMRDKLKKVPEGDWWMCEDCKKSECKKSKSQVNLESSSTCTAELKLKSSQDWKRQTGVSTRSCSSANRHGVQSEAQSLKEDRVTRMSAKSCDNTPLQHTYKTFKNEKAEETKDTTSDLQISCNAQDKAKVSHAVSDKRCADTIQVELDRKTKALEASARFSKASKSTKISQPIRESLSENLGKTNVEQSSYVSQEKTKLHSHSGSPLLMPGLPEIADVKFKGHQVEASYLPMKKRKMREFVSSSALDLNVNPQDEIDKVGAQEIGEFAAMDTSFSGDKVVLGRSDLVPDLNISHWPESTTPEVDPCLPVENVDDQPSQDVNFKMQTEEKKNDDQDKPHEENLKNNNAEESNTDRAESLASPTSDEEYLNLLHWEAVELLSYNFRL